ncbi:MAG: endo-1,4-beta-xylanase, partial [candidate division KSB1 bacterium]|nr:endo-1,4-beta-xylanase [candidate division KSB1 bacterium]
MKTCKSNYLCLLLSLTGLTFAQAPDPKFADYLATERDKLPVAGELLYDCSRLTGYSLGGGTAALRRVTAAADLPFTQAYQIDVKRVGANSWEPQFVSPKNAVAVRQGDMLFWVLWVRSLSVPPEYETGKAFFYAQLAESPWTGIASHDLAPIGEWEKIYIYGQSPQDFPIGKMEFTIHLGFYPQVLEIGGIIALNLGRNIDPAKLPKNRITYAGREANAPWRAEAEARIEQLRKGNLRIVVKNQAGLPIKNARVKVEMQRHAFRFGSFMDGPLFESSRNGQKYREEVFKLFNAATTPFYMGDGTWGWYASEQVRQDYRRRAEWLVDNGFRTKGHVLIWPGWTWMTPYFRSLANNAAGLRQALLEHLETVVPVGREAGVEEWDVVNEPYTNHDVMDLLGDEVLVEWYQKVHELHPEARLILNETGVLISGGDIKVQDNLARIVELLLSRGAPLHGLGFQGHFGAVLTTPRRLKEILDRFAAYGLPIQITEFDIDIDDEEAQADYTRDFLTLIFSHPGVNKFVMWGFWEPIQWRPRGAMIRKDWSYKPNYHAYVDLVLNRWWTRTEGTTDAEGVYEIRGFLGSYRIAAEFEGAVKEIAADLEKPQNEVAIELPTDATGIRSRNEAEFDFRLFPNPTNSAFVVELYLPESAPTRIEL